MHPELKYRDHYEYPGHPLVVALIIMEVFGKYSDALAKTEHNWCAAVGSCEVPGAGGNVYAGSDLLVKLKNGMPIDEAVSWAHDWWEGCVGPGTDNLPKAYEPGLRGAKVLEPVFRDTAAGWDWT